MANSERFYESLRPFGQFSQCTREEVYRTLPDDWHVVITDIRGSTQAIEAGRYKHVNAVAVASIAAIRNTLKPLSIPFAFGGDGISACVPGRRLAGVGPALVAAQAMAAQRFGLNLRIGAVAAHTLRAAGHELRIAKFQPYPQYQQAMFSGSGLTAAEEWVKSGRSEYRIPAGAPLNDQLFNGFECRWSEIPAPSEENVTLLAQALSNDIGVAHRIYAQLLRKIEALYGTEENYRPVQERLLALTGSVKLLSVESRIRTAFQPRWRWLLYALKLQGLRWVGNAMMRLGLQTGDTDWGNYKNHFVQNADYRKFDGMLRMILSGTKRQRRKLIELLERHRHNGDIAYGLHVAPSALVTCIIDDYAKHHIHLLDASNGGYAMAAKQLKAGLADAATPAQTTTRQQGL